MCNYGYKRDATSASRPIEAIRGQLGASLCRHRMPLVTPRRKCSWSSQRNAPPISVIYKRSERDARQHQFNFVRRLSWSICSIFQRKKHSKCAPQPKNSKTNHSKPIFLVLKVVQGHRCWYPRNLVSSACYDTQQVCVYLQPFSC